MDALSCEGVARVLSAGVPVIAGLQLVDASGIGVAAVERARIPVVAIGRSVVAGTADVAASLKARIAKRTIAVVLTSLGHNRNVLTPVIGAEVEGAGVVITAVLSRRAATRNGLDGACSVRTRVVCTRVSIVALEVQYTAVWKR